MDERTRDLLKALGTAPESQCEPTTAKKIGDLALQDTAQADEVKAILDEIVYGSLASGFMVNALNMVWKNLLDAEGRSGEYPPPIRI